MGSSAWVTAARIAAGSGPRGVARPDVDEARGAVLRDDEHGRHRQLPLATGVDPGEVVAEGQLYLLDVVGELEDDAELAGVGTARVGEDREGQAIRLGGGKAAFWALRADGDQGDPLLGELGQYLVLVGPESNVAVRAPGAAVEDEHSGAAGEDCVEVHGRAVCGGERERRHGVSDGDVARAVGGAVEPGLLVGEDAEQVRWGDLGEAVLGVGQAVGERSGGGHGWDLLVRGAGRREVGREVARTLGSGGDDSQSAARGSRRLLRSALENSGGVQRQAAVVARARSTCSRRTSRRA